MEEFFKRNYIRDYHVYKEAWEAVVGEALVCEREPENEYIVAVKKGHLPQKLSRVCSLFL